MTDTLPAALVHARPAVALHSYFVLAREAVRDACGPQAPALIARLVEIELLAELAAIEVAAERSMRVPGGAA